jgi:hypothetical protein
MVRDAPLRDAPHHEAVRVPSLGTYFGAAPVLSPGWAFCAFVPV